jgi:hypothetical protein
VLCKYNNVVCKRNDVVCERNDVVHKINRVVGERNNVARTRSYIYHICVTSDKQTHVVPGKCPDFLIRDIFSQCDFTLMKEDALILLNSLKVHFRNSGNYNRIFLKCYIGWIQTKASFLRKADPF